jgi:hypothetical protein
MAGAYADFLVRFAEQGVTECPAWEKVRTVNPITHAVVKAVSRKLLQPIKQEPSLTGAEELPALGTSAMLDELEEKNLYRASSVTPVQTSRPVGSVAAVCAAGFAGFVLEAEGDLVLTDPPSWLLPMTFNNAAQDPFLYPGFYHPMSYYGGAPGVQFAHYNRFAPCPGCPPETCSYYAGIHVKLPLQGDCLDPSNLATCVAFCAPRR